MKQIYWFLEDHPVVLLLAVVCLILAILWFWLIPAGIVKVPTPTTRDVCKAECTNGWTSKIDWTCIKNCEELNK